MYLLHLFPGAVILSQALVSAAVPTHDFPWDKPNDHRRLDECGYECDTIPDNSIHYCSTTISYRVCRTTSSWAAMAETFPARIANMGIDLDVLNEAAGDESHPSNRCAKKIVALQCKAIFPACEIGQEVRRVCDSACMQVVAACEGQEGFEVDERMCEDNNDFTSDQTCIYLSYSGANKVLWIAGFSIGLIFSFLAALGLNLQKMSMNAELLKPERERRSTLKQPIWVVGLSLITGGSLLDFVAFGLAPQSLLAPLGALSLVWNLMIAPLFNNEKLTRSNLIATAIIVLGTLMTVIFSPHATPTYTLDDLLALYSAPTMMGYSVCVLLFALKLMRNLRQMHPHGKLPLIGRFDPTWQGEAPAVASGRIERGESQERLVVEGSRGSRDCDGSPNTPSKHKEPRGQSPGGVFREKEKEKQKNETEMREIISWGGLAGCFGGCSVLLAKSSVELMKNVITGTERGAFSYPAPYLILTGMALCLFIQINTLNAGLSRFNALLIVPVYQSFWIMFSVLGGMIYFEEYRSLNPVQTGFFIVGMVITYAGVIYLLRERRRGGDGEEGYAKVVDDYEEDEEGIWNGDDSDDEGSWEGMTRRDGVTGARGAGLSPSGIELGGLPQSPRTIRGGGATGEH